MLDTCGKGDKQHDQHQSENEHREHDRMRQQGAVVVLLLCFVADNLAGGTRWGGGTHRKSWRGYPNWEQTPPARKRTSLSGKKIADPYAGCWLQHSSHS